MERRGRGFRNYRDRGSHPKGDSHAQEVEDPHQNISDMTRKPQRHQEEYRRRETGISSTSQEHSASGSKTGDSHGNMSGATKKRPQWHQSKSATTSEDRRHASEKNVSLPSESRGTSTVNISSDRRHPSGKWRSRAPSNTAAALAEGGSLSKGATSLVERGFSFSRKGFSRTSDTGNGKYVIVKANFFEIQKFSLEKAFHYDISFEPEKPKRLLSLALEEFKLKHFPKIIMAFDGRKNVYTMIPLPCKDKNEIRDKVKVCNEEKNRIIEFKVTVKHVACVDLSLLDQKCIQVLEIVLRSAAALKYSSIGRSYFSFGGVRRPIHILDGFEVRSGLHVSVKPGEKLYVNIDTVHKVFLKPQPVVDLIKEILAASSHMNRNQPLQNNPLQRNHIFQLKQLLTGSKVSRNFGSYSRTDVVYDIALPPSELTFKFEDQMITVEDYFRHEKKVPLKYQNWPCLNLGSSNRPVYVPVEHCTIVIGQVRNKLNDKQRSEVIKYSSPDPPVREEKIIENVKYLDFENSPLLNEFNVKINPDILHIKAHVLDHPTLEYQTERILPENGEWRTKSSFCQGSTLRKWTILILDDCVQLEEALMFAEMFRKQGTQRGMTIDTPHSLNSINTRKYDHLETCLNKELTDYREYDMVFIVGFKDKRVYPIVKKTAELKVGLLTQYITTGIIKTRKDHQINQIIHNVVLKVNAKLGGINQTLLHSKFSGSSIMYVGADVTHPTSDEAGTPSVAAVCASHDSTGFQYNSQIRIQKRGTEIIAELEEIMVQHLTIYEKKTNRTPEIILFFRDGVADNQFEAVRKYELAAIQRASSKLKPNYKPKITFLVVQKRHHARFFPTEQRDSRYKNVAPGTVVDNTITKPDEGEFYLVSHSSPRGTSRPCRYHCLWDDNDLSKDELEEIAFSLCFTYSRCDKSVSYPTPVYYAHHAATRGKMYLYGEHPKNWNNRFLQSQFGSIQKLPLMHFV